MSEKTSRFFALARKFLQPGHHEMTTVGMDESQIGGQIEQSPVNGQDPKRRSRKKKHAPPPPRPPPPSPAKLKEDLPASNIEKDVSTEYHVSDKDAAKISVEEEQATKTGHYKNSQLGNPENSDTTPEENGAVLDDSLFEVLDAEEDSRGQTDQSQKETASEEIFENNQGGYKHQTIKNLANTKQESDADKAVLKLLRETLHEVTVLQEEINSLSASCSVNDFAYLEDLLMKKLMQLDDIDTGNNRNLRLERKNGILYVQGVLKMLDSKMKQKKEENVCARDRLI